MKVIELIARLQIFEPELHVFVDGHDIKGGEGSIYAESHGVIIRTEKTSRESRKCPFRKITTNESIKVDKDGTMSPMKTVEEFGPCYEKNCPYYDTIAESAGFFRCRKTVNKEGEKE